MSPADLPNFPWPHSTLPHGFIPPSLPKSHPCTRATEKGKSSGFAVSFQRSFCVSQIYLAHMENFCTLVKWSGSCSIYPIHWRNIYWLPSVSFSQDSQSEKGFRKEQVTSISLARATEREKRHCVISWSGDNCLQLETKGNLQPQPGGTGCRLSRNILPT